MASMSIQTVSSSSSHMPQWSYDVFLSFQSEDSQMFADHLYGTLHQKGINAFKDVRKGKAIVPERLEGIEDSKFSVVIFSRNYASSTWCLDELVEILECMNTLGQVAFPVFYGVDPSDVRNQTGCFEEVFVKYEEDFGKNTQKVKNWRTAMAGIASQSGWDSKDRHESQLIQDIVKEIFTRLNHTLSSAPKDLVGIDSHLQKLILCLDRSFNDVHILGIHGMGGVGKTTIARVVFDQTLHQYEGGSFLANVREVSEKHGLVVLQTQLLNNISKEKNIQIWDVTKGTNILRNRLCRKRVLLVIDDVDKLDQLDTLVGNRDWFGLGSRIIITTRDVHLLVRYGVDEVYKMEGLNDYESFQLFSLQAFKTVDPPEEFVELSKEVVRYCNGLPLALEVLGKFMCGRSADEWTSALKRLKQYPHKDILGRLQISFDGLEDTEKKIFLDIACFFKGMDQDYVTNILESSGFYAAIGIRVLIDKSLITIVDENKLWMHDLLQEMGKNMVWKESPDEPGKRSRLFVDEDVYNVLTKNTGTEAVELITYNSMEQENVNLCPKAFFQMHKLRLLKISNVQLPQGLESLPNELRLLQWLGYPLKFLPLSFQPDKIVDLDLHWSCLKQLWGGTKILSNLKFINLSHSKDLKKIPDFTGMPNVEKIVLEGCTSLVEVHSSVWLLKELIFLNMKDCKSLLRLPSGIEMKSLEALILSGCSKLKKFPQITGSMEHLSEICLDGTAIEQLPCSIEHLTGLNRLNLNACKNLKSLPDNIGRLKSLKTLALSGCMKLETLPESLGHVECLEELDVGGTAIRKPPASIVQLQNLKELSFRGCGRNQLPKPWISLLNSLLFPRKSSDSMCLLLPPLSGLHSLTKLDLSNCNLLEGVVPNDLDCLSSLKTLDLSDNEFVSLPGSISQLVNLEELYLVNCKRLQSLPEFPARIGHLKVDDCISLEKFPYPLKLCNSVRLVFNLYNCHRLVHHSNTLALLWLKTYLQGLPRPCRGFQFCLPASGIPEWFTHQSEGSSLSIDLPPNWRNSTFMGLATCFLFKTHRDQDHNFKVRCIITADAEICIDTGFFKTSTQVGSEHLKLMYLPLGARHGIDVGEPERVTVKYSLLSDHWKIKNCGGRLVFARDVEELNEMINSSSDAYGDRDDPDRSAENEDTIKRKRGIYGGPEEPGGSGDFSDEKTQPKRMKKL